MHENSWNEPKKIVQMDRKRKIVQMDKNSSNEQENPVSHWYLIKN